MYTLTHLQHVELAKNRVQHSGVTLDHVELDDMPSCCKAHDERESAKHQRVPMPCEGLADEIRCCGINAASMWLLLALEEQGVAMPTAQVRPLRLHSG
jgi:hypothetical protein